MNLGDPDVVETSDVEEFEELEGSTQDLPKNSVDYLRENTDESDMQLPPKKRTKVSNFLSFCSRHLFSTSSYHTTLLFPMPRMFLSFLPALFIRHYGAIPHLRGLNLLRQL